MNILHVVDQWPAIPLSFIREQFVCAEHRRDAVLASTELEGVPGLAPPDDRLESESLDRRPSVVRRAWRERGGFRRHSRRLAQAAQKALETREADVVHAHFGSIGAELAAGGFQRPFVTTFYGADVSQSMRKSRWRARYSMLAARRGRAIVLCEAARARLLSADFEEDQVFVERLAVDFSRYPLLEPPNPSPELRLVCAARFVEKKGHDDLLRAFALVAHERPARLRLLGYGPGAGRIVALAGSLGVSERVSLLDTSKLPDFDPVFLAALRDADVFVLASREAADGDDEGGPALTAVCAQAAGVPIVVTSYPGSEEHVEHLRTGMVVPQRAPRALADAVLGIAADEPRARVIARVAAGKVRADFSRERLLAAMQNHYDQVANT